MQKINIEYNKIIRVMNANQILYEEDSLSLFQKILLLTDGTVTDLLSIYTKKNIYIKKINQKFVPTFSNLEILCDENSSILKREILLCTEKENLIYADSQFYLDNMSKKIRDKMFSTDIPVGKIWKEEGLNTYREIISLRIELCETLSKYFYTNGNTPFLARTYSIKSDDKIIGLITEKFPITHFS